VVGKLTGHVASHQHALMPWCVATWHRCTPQQKRTYLSEQGAGREADWWTQEGRCAFARTLGSGCTLLSLQPGQMCIRVCASMLCTPQQHPPAVSSMTLEVGLPAPCPALTSTRVSSGLRCGDSGEPASTCCSVAVSLCECSGTTRSSCEPVVMRKAGYCLVPPAGGRTL
jgi:hypothetical protein